jgi:hypothetical protein
VNVRPKYLADVTDSSVCPWSWYLASIIFFVLGPGLFLYCINDLQSRLTSTVRLFVDETIAYLTIFNNNDAETLQNDLDKLGHWENEWCMKMHSTLSNQQKENNPSITTDRFLFASQFCIHLTDFPIIP